MSDYSVTPWTVVTRLLCPWNSPGQNTGVGCHALLQGSSQPRDRTQVYPHCRWIFYHLSHQGSLKRTVKVKVTQLCPTLCNPTDYTVHGIFLGQNIGVDSLSLLQGIFSTQGSNPGLLHFRQIIYHLKHKGSPKSNYTPIKI